jgi:hypothetical protein
MRRTIPKSPWAEIHTSYASGIGLREIAHHFVRLDHVASVIVNANDGIM